MFLNTLAIVLSLAAAVTPLPTTHVTRTTGDIDLYAYGEDISGLQLWSGSDGKYFSLGFGLDHLSELVLMYGIVNTGKAYVATSAVGQANSSLFELICESPNYVIQFRLLIRTKSNHHDTQGPHHLPMPPGR